MKRRYLFEHEVDLSKPKKTLYDVIFRKRYEGLQSQIPFGDLPANLEPADLIEIHEEEAFYSENESWEDHTTLIIERPRLETDEEQQERLEKSQAFMEELRERRYETYLKLKEEFEEPPKPIM
jgi:hypothetical protein